MSIRTTFLASFLCLNVSLRAAEPAAPAPADWPAAWSTAWADPPAELRPLQIVHGVAPDRATVEAMKSLKALGLGGIVCNVAFSDYLVSDTHWATLVKAVESCREAGLVVWLYDEKGYPSGSAGGLVLKKLPECEALALAYDASQPDPFVVRRAYEHSHASNNFCAARRCPNLIDADAVKTFISVTHDAYRQRLEKHFGTTIQAIFTDEPSLMAVDLGQLPEHIRKSVPVDDPLDETVKPLPCVPWSRDLTELYQKRYGEDLLTVRRSLFTGEAESDRAVRRRFWALIADLIGDRYFGQIEAWCGRNGISSSGHTLWEENLVHHVPLEGNALQVLRRMHIPGLDMLSSDPQVVIYAGWMTAGLPASAALIEGRRKVMTEVSDFVQGQAGKGPATLAEMQATAAWQAALGVTEFTLYYTPSQRPAEQYRAYNDYAGRLNAVLREARPETEVVLYYPICDIWAEYRPMAGPLRVEAQPERIGRIVDSFSRLGQRLLTAQLPFLIADHAVLGAAQMGEGRLRIGQQACAVVVLPAEAELPEPAAGVLRRFAESGGKVVRDDADGRKALAAFEGRFDGRGRLEPASTQIVLGRFVREGRQILLLVNVGPQEYAGTVATERPGTWRRADPATGAIEPVQTDAQGRVPLRLPARSAILLTGELRK